MRLLIPLMLLGVVSLGLAVAADATNFGDVESGSLIKGPGSRQFNRYRERVRIIHDMLLAECPGVEVSRLRREVISDVHRTLVRVEVALYEKMVKMLIDCQKRKAAIDKSTTTLKATTTTPKPTTTTPKPTTTTPKPTTTTPKPTTTTPKPATTTSVSVPQPPECQKAINLTESWRQDNKGSKILPGGKQNCDTKTMGIAGRPWFRFSGAAGNKMLDTCPPDHSCGSHIGVWTDVAMPSDVGVAKDITAYGSWNNKCAQFTEKISVMRCSLDTAHDFIYKDHVGGASCHLSYCGMTA